MGVFRESAIALLVTVSCKSLNVDSQLSGRNSEVAPATLHPYVGALVRDSFGTVGKQKCTGTLLSKDKVITAHHCVSHANLHIKADLLTFYLPSGQKIKGQQIETLSTFLDSELAIVTLAERVAGLEFPPLLSSNLIEGEIGQTIGYGKVSYDPWYNGDRRLEPSENYGPRQTGRMIFSEYENESLDILASSHVARS